MRRLLPHMITAVVICSAALLIPSSARAEPSEGRLSGGILPDQRRARIEGWVSVNGSSVARQDSTAHAIVGLKLILPGLEWSLFEHEAKTVTPEVVDEIGNRMEQVWEAQPGPFVSYKAPAVYADYVWVATSPLPPGEYAVRIRTDPEDALARIRAIKPAALTVTRYSNPEEAARHSRKVHMMRGEYESVVQELESLAIEQPDSVFVGMELIEAYIAAGELDEAEATVHRYIDRATCGEQSVVGYLPAALFWVINPVGAGLTALLPPPFSLRPAPCHPNEQKAHLFWGYFGQIKLARQVRTGQTAGQ